MEHEGAFARDVVDRAELHDLRLELAGPVDEDQDRARRPDCSQDVVQFAGEQRGFSEVSGWRRPASGLASEPARRERGTLDGYVPNAHIVRISCERRPGYV